MAAKSNQLLKIKSCRKCKLRRNARQVVLGRGTMPADILFIGEAPGASEDLIGEAFIGPSGKLLDMMLKEIDVKSFYITNTVLCRPPENRSPLSEEVLSCARNITKIISKVSPKLVVFLGDIAQKYWGKEFPDGIRIQHPAFILRKGGMASPYYQHNLRLLRDALQKGEVNASKEKI